MHVPEKVQEWLRKNPSELKNFQGWPLAYFGNFIKYPKQALIIRTWLEVQPKICLITGYKRCAKTAIGAWIGSSWLVGGINSKWPGSRSMGIEKDFNWKKNNFQDRVGLIGGKSLDHVENVLLKQYRSFLPPSYIKQWFSKGNHRISLHEKRWMNVRSYDQDLDAWKSAESELTHLDEEPPYEVLMECLERSRTCKGKIIITVAVDDADVSYLPDACTNPKKYFGTESFLHFKMGVEDVPNDIYPDEEKKIVFAQYDGTPYEAAVRKGEFSYTSGRWWPEFDVRTHVIKAFPIPKEWKRFRFIDAGMAAPCACAWVAVHPKNILFVYREYYKTGTTIDQRCKDIIEASGNQRQKDGGMWIEIQSREKFELDQLDYHEFRQDAHTGDGLDYEYVKCGINVQPSTTLNQQARRDLARKWLWIDQKETHFITGHKGAPRIYFLDNCPNLIWEAQKKSFKRTLNERTGTSEAKIQNKDDHLMDCTEYGCAELSWMVEEVEMI